MSGHCNPLQSIVLTAQLLNHLAVPPALLTILALQLCELRPGSNRCFGVWLLCEGGAPSADSDDGWF